MSLSIHLMIYAVVQDQDLTLPRAPWNLGACRTWPAVELHRRNATLLSACRRSSSTSSNPAPLRQRVEYMTMPVEGAPMPMPAPIQVTVGGATVFALPVERYEQF
jgi:hypothetical protein